MMVRESSGWSAATGFRTLRLATTLVVLLVVTIAVTMGSVGYVSFRNGQEAVIDVASQLQDSFNARIKQNLDDFLSTPHSLNRVNAEALRSGLVNPRDFPSLRARFLQQVQAFGSVVTCAFGSAGGDFIGAGWRSEGVFDSALADKAVDNDYRVFVLDDQGKPAEMVSIIRDYDPRLRSWYQAALQTQQPTWSPIYVWASQTNIGISAVLPVYDGSGALMGVQLSALSLERIERFLGSLKIGISGQAFIVERSGLLVASSVETSARRSPGGQKAATERFQAAESASPLIRSAARHLTERYGDLERIAVGEKTMVTLDGRKYFLNVTPFSDGRGLEWIITTIVPESDFMAHVNANARATLLMSISALIVAVLLGVFMARWLTHPIVKLNAAAQEMSRGRWQEVAGLDRFEEVGQLATSFNLMANQLRESFETLESRVRERTSELAAANERLHSDIAERKRAEEALRESEERYRWIVETAEEGIATHEPDGTITYINERMAEMLGYSREEIIGRSSLDFVDEEEREAVIRARESLKEGGRFTKERKMRRKDGSTLWTLSHVCPQRDGAGLFIGYLAMHTDITSRKQVEEALRKSEERFRIAEQLAGMGHFEWDVANNVIVTSSSLERIHGLEPGAFKGGYENWLPMVYSEDRARVNEIVQSAFAEKRREERFEFRIVRPDGDLRWLSMEARATYDGSGRPLGVMGAMTDITDIKKAQEELRKSRDDLEKRVQERTFELSQAVERVRVENVQRKQLEDTLRQSEYRVRFFASQCLTAQETERKRVAAELHDSIAASLAAIKLRIERMAEESDSGPSRTGSLQEIASRVAELNTDVRRIMADLRPSILDDLGIVAAVNWFCREYQKTYPRISVEKQIGIQEPEVPDSLKTPIFRICQEAMNNIAKYSQASLVNLSLQARDGRIELTIRDNGRGFDPNTVKRGLGLSTMKERAELSGGSFDLESAIGKGTAIRASWRI